MMGTAVIDDAGIYLTRDGREIEIIGKSRSKKPYDRQWVGLDNRDCFVRYPEDGKWLNDHEDCEHDIVAKKPKPKTGKVYIYRSRSGNHVDSLTPASGFHPRDTAALQQIHNDKRIIAVLDWVEGMGMPADGSMPELPPTKL